jgi:hypothetical protein
VKLVDKTPQSTVLVADLVRCELVVWDGGGVISATVCSHMHFVLQN